MAAVVAVLLGRGVWQPCHRWSRRALGRLLELDATWAGRDSLGSPLAQALLLAAGAGHYGSPSSPGLQATFIAAGAHVAAHVASAASVYTLI